MKKIILSSLCVLSLCTVISQARAVSPIQFSVNESDKAKYEALIKSYKDEYTEVTKKAEDDIKAAQEKFEKTRAESEKIITEATSQIKKLEIDAANAKQNFERVRSESNAKIEDANKRIQKASDDYKAKLEAVAKSAQ